MDIANIYASKHYKKLLIIPLVMTILGLFFATQVKFGIEFSGGTLITAPVENDINALQLKEKLLSEYDLVDLDVRQTGAEFSRGIYVQFLGETTLLDAQAAYEAGDYDAVISLSKKYSGDVNASGEIGDVASAHFSKARENFKNGVVNSISESIGTPAADFSTQDIGPSLGAFFWEQGKNAILMAFFFIAILVFLFFRETLVSFAVIQAAIFDVIIAVGFMGLANIPLSLSTLAPLLMLIGYSVDSDIMLTERILKRKEGTPEERAAGAFSTGMTMTGTSIGAITALYVVSSLASIDTISTIALILLVGLVGDLFATWITNITLVFMSIERKVKR